MATTHRQSFLIALLTCIALPLPALAEAFLNYTRPPSRPVNQAFIGQIVSYPTFRPVTPPRPQAPAAAVAPAPPPNDPPPSQPVRDAGPITVLELGDGRTVPLPAVPRALLPD